MSSGSLYHDIEKVIIYIEDNLKHEICLDEISEHVCISKFHLNRIFHAISKTSLMGYVRKRKLSSSTVELLGTDLKISDISQEYGFEYEQSYIRSFKNNFGISPDKFRKNKTILKITDKLNLDYVRSIGNDGVTLAPPIVVVPEFFITGIRHKINDSEDMIFYEANARGNDFYFHHRHKIQNVLYKDVYIGYVQQVPGDENHTYYTPSVQVPSQDKTPPGMVCLKIPTNKYAVFKYIGLHHPRHINSGNLLNTFIYIYGEWFPKSGYSKAAPYHFERIDEKISHNEYCEMEIYVPVN